MLEPSKLDAHIAQFGIELEGMHPALATSTRLPRTTKRRTQVAQQPAVDPGNAHIDICRHKVRAAQVIGPHRCGQAIAVGIHQRQQFLFAVERSDVAARAKGDNELPVLHDWHEIGLRLFTKPNATVA